MNQHSARIWSMENPQAVEEVPVRSEKVMVWCAMHKTKMIGPYFFRRLSIDSAVSKSMLRYYGLQHMQPLPGSPIFQQDGAPVYTANTVKEYLSRKLVNNWITGEQGLLT